MKKYLYLIIVALAIMLFFCIKSNQELRNEPAKIVRETITIVKFDTIGIIKPIYITERVIDTFLMPILDTLRINDTLYQPIPKTQKYYAKDSTYQAWVSGYKPALDSINVFQKHTVKTITIRIPQKKWGIGIMGGYGVNQKGLTPFVGVGVYYKIF